MSGGKKLRTVGPGGARIAPAWFELRPGFPPGEEIARIIGRQVSAARRALTQDGEPLPARVHKARTACKRIRAALALAGEPSSRSVERLKKSFRDLGRPLAEIREATVMMLTYETLRRDLAGRMSRESAEVVRRLVARQRRQTVSDRAAIDRTLSAVADRLLAVGGHLGVLEGLRLDAAALARAFGVAYRRARRAHLQLSRSASRMHRWRKRAKSLLHQCALLAPCRPQVFKAWRRELSLLDGLLGREHDLVVLDSYLKEHRSDANRAEIQAFRRWIGLRRGELRGRAYELGRLIFSAKPGATRRSLTAWLELAAGRKYPPAPGPAAHRRGKGLL